MRVCIQEAERVGVEQRRAYSHVPLSIDMIKDRILLVLRLYDKINPDKVCSTLALSLANVK